MSCDQCKVSFQMYYEILLWIYINFIHKRICFPRSFLSWQMFHDSVLFNKQFNKEIEKFLGIKREQHDVFKIHFMLNPCKRHVITEYFLSAHISLKEPSKHTYTIVLYLHTSLRADESRIAYKVHVP